MIFSTRNTDDHSVNIFFDPSLAPIHLGCSVDPAYKLEDGRVRDLDLPQSQR